MEKRFFYTLLCLIAVLLLPARMRAEDKAPYAVLCKGDQSIVVGASGDASGTTYPNAVLYFTYAASVPSEGETYQGQEVLGVWEVTNTDTDRTSEETRYPGWRRKYADASAETPSVRYCSLITKVVFEDSFRDARPVSCKFWFYGCARLTEVVGLENLNTESVVNMGSMFRNCSSLASLDLSTFDTSSLTIMEYMFRGCSSLTSINLSSFNTEKVTDMQRLFAQDSLLTEIDIKNFYTPNVTTFRDMFNNCKGLRSVNVSNLDIYGATILGMFQGCSSLTELDLTSFRNQPTRSLNYFFYDCTNLERIYVSELWSESTYKANGVFKNNTKLVGGSGTVYNSKKNGQTYARIDGGTSAPGYLTGTTPYVLYGECTPSEAGATTQKVLYFTSSPTAFNIYETEDTPNATFTDGTNTYQVKGVWSGTDVTKCPSTPGWLAKSDVTKVIFSSKFGAVRPTTCANWFSGLSALAAVEGLSHLNTSAVVSMENMFKGTAITSLDFAEDGIQFRTNNVTNMSGMFQDCASLAVLVLSPRFATSMVTTMKDIFSGCSALTSLTGLDAFDTSNVTDMSGMFHDCANLGGALDLSHFYTGNVTTLANMFSGDVKLENLDLASFDLSKVASTAGMFKGCSLLESIYVGLVWDVENVSESADMFAGCTHIKGGNATPYDSSKTDKEYAVIDDGVSMGYLTEKYPLVAHFYADRNINGVLTAYAGQKVTVFVHRDFSASTWTTICLPFDMTAKQVESIFGAGTELKTLGSVTREGAAIQTVTYEDAASIEAGKPYLFKPAKTLNVFHLTHRVISDKVGADNKMGFSMRGLLSPTTVSEESLDAETFYTLADEQTGSVPAFSAGSNNDGTNTYIELGAGDEVNGLTAYFSKTNSETVTAVLRNGTDTFSSEYDLDFTNSEVKAYIGSMFALNTSGGGNLMMARIYDVPAGTGVVLVGEKGSYEIPISSNKNVVTNLLVANPVKQKVPQIVGDYTNFFCSTSDGSFKKVSANGTSIGAGRAYLPIPTDRLITASNNAPIRDIRLVFEDEEATGIESVESAADREPDNIYYNLNGQRVAAPTKGIYIVNGKKVFVK